MAVEVHIRPAIPDDHNLIWATWLENYKHSSSLGRRVRPDVYYAGQRKVIDHALKQGETLIASPLGDDLIVGYLVHTNASVIQYCYVKQSFRRMGIGKALLTALPWKEFTHWTDDCAGLMKKFPNVVYNPYGALHGS